MTDLDHVQAELEEWRKNPRSLLGTEIGIGLLEGPVPAMLEELRRLRKLRDGLGDVAVRW